MAEMCIVAALQAQCTSTDLVPEQPMWIT
ncbi:uncharacterized protein G2W53_034333 [Senna tora]|uniref:Uncharacterized protein n=1 Tax=Senna tora TaxID=362788 RepID=A0A834T1P3_9FABA|nr:uncharacterized protein G2W53_034333 [Senna tora]